MFLSFEIVPHLSPKVSQSLLMKEELSFELHAHEVEVPFSTVQHISPNEKIENVDDVLGKVQVKSSALKDELLSLPSICHLKRFSQSLTVEAGFSKATVKYLKQRASYLNLRQKL